MADNQPKQGVPMNAKEHPSTDKPPASDSHWGTVKGVPMPTSSYGADFSSDYKMTPDFTLDLQAKDWKSSK